jgi:hypothetical protein
MATPERVVDVLERVAQRLQEEVGDKPLARNLISERVAILTRDSLLHTRRS